jgi:arylsulfatase A-like enzyme
MRLMRLMFVLLGAFCLPLLAAERPNILWIISEDMSPHFGCYGETAITTPQVDRLAKEGVRFSRAYVTAPICSTSRSAIITGMYQTAIGAQHHRSGRGEVKISLPAGVTPVPALFRQAGYWTCNGDFPEKAKAKGIAKTDYNFEWDASIYDGNDWATRKPGQPFFAQIQLWGGKVRDGAKAADIFQKELGLLTAPEKFLLPPYYPRTPAILTDWGLTLDACRLVDLQVGQIRARLEKEGLWDNTVVMFITDHGVSHARGKQFLYDEGTHIPCIMRGPGLPVGMVRQDLIEHIDLAATSLALAGIAKPTSMQARDVLAPNYQPREAVFGARDRADETVDHMRSVRTERWLYIRNYLPNRPALQPNNYKDHKPCLIALRAAQAAGQLDDLQQRLLFAPTRPTEELYDLSKDHFQVDNIAGDPAQAGILADLRSRLATWELETNDHGRVPESEAQYDSDMASYLKERKDPETVRNIELMKQWAKDGK